MSNGQDIVDVVGGQDIIQPDSQYVIDLVFCIDATRSMGGIIEQTKQQCGEMVEQVSTRMRGKRPLKAFRVGIIEFRDLEQDKARQMVVHDFVDVLDAKGETSVAALTANLAKIEARGGGDAEESSLDALLRAFKMPFYEPGPDEAVRLRRVVVLFTDEPPRPIHATTKEAGEESLSDKDIALIRANAVLKELEQRIIFVVPESQQFNELAEAVPNSKKIKLERGQGDVGVYKPEDFEPVLKWIVESFARS